MQPSSKHETKTTGFGDNRTTEPTTLQKSKQINQTRTIRAQKKSGQVRTSPPVDLDLCWWVKYAGSQSSTFNVHSASFAWLTGFKSVGGRDIVSSSLEEERLFSLVAVRSRVVPFVCPVRLSCALQVLGRPALCQAKTPKNSM